MIRTLTATCAVALLGLASCGGESPAPAPAPPPTSSNANGTAPEPGRPDEPDSERSEPFEGTAGVVEVRRDRQELTLLREVRTGGHETFDRIVFEFEGPVPGYRVEYVDRPVRQCGSGNAVEVAGDGWLEIDMTPAAAHTDAGEATIAERERRLSFPNLVELESTCDFEGHVTWVAGVRSPNRYRVLELKSPSRLVVDVKR